MVGYNKYYFRNTLANPWFANKRYSLFNYYCNTFNNKLYTIQKNNPFRKEKWQEEKEINL